MSGASNRRRGHDWERLCAGMMALTTDDDVRTTRSLGASYGADLATVTGYDAHGRPALHVPWVDLGGTMYSVECKAVAQRNPRKWLRQARDQAAPGTTPVVLWQRKHHSFGAGSVFLIDEDAPRGWTETSIEEWLADLVPAT